MGKIKGKKKEQGRKLPQIKGRQRCLKVKWKGKEEKAKKKRRRIEEGVPEKKKNQGMAGMENRSEKVGKAK